MTLDKILSIPKGNNLVDYLEIALPDSERAIGGTLVHFQAESKSTLKILKPCSRSPPSAQVKPRLLTSKDRRGCS
jgi:hypothetical protein